MSEHTEPRDTESIRRQLDAQDRVRTAPSAPEHGFAPDSVYAEWTPEERAAADRMEAEYNVHARAVRAVADLMRRADRAKQPKDTGPLYIAGPTVRGYSESIGTRRSSGEP